MVLPVPMTLYQTPGAVLEVPQVPTSSKVAVVVEPTVSDGIASAIASSHKSLGEGHTPGPQNVKSPWYSPPRSSSQNNCVTPSMQSVPMQQAPVGSPLPQSQNSAAASAHILSHSTSQQNGSISQMRSWHAKFSQPAPCPVSRQLPQSSPSCPKIGLELTSDRINLSKRDGVCI